MHGLRSACLILLFSNTWIYPSQEEKRVTELTALLAYLRATDSRILASNNKPTLYYKKRGEEHERDPWLPHPNPRSFPLNYDPTYHYVRVLRITRKELPRRSITQLPVSGEKVYLILKIKLEPVEIFLSIVIPVTFEVVAAQSTQN